MPIGACDIHSPVSVGVLDLSISARLQQQAHNLVMAALGRPVKRAAIAIVVAFIHPLLKLIEFQELLKLILV